MRLNIICISGFGKKNKIADLNLNLNCKARICHHSTLTKYQKLKLISLEASLNGILVQAVKLLTLLQKKGFREQVPKIKFALPQQ
jgi:hypothetical protein